MSTSGEFRERQHLSGPTRTKDSSAHNDTFQTFSRDGGSVRNMLHYKGVYFSAGDKAMQGDTASVKPVLDDSLVYEPSTTGKWIPGASPARPTTATTPSPVDEETGTIRNSTVVGSLGAKVRTMVDSVLYSENTFSSIANPIDVEVRTGNEAPEILPKDMTHAYLDSVWSK